MAAKYNRQPLKRLSWCEWRVMDPIDQKKYTSFYLSVYQPTWEHPYPSLLLRMQNGSGSSFLRFGSMAGLQEVFVVPDEYIERLTVAMNKAGKVADGIIEGMKLAIHRRELAEGGKIIRTDTGEVLAEAERILQGGT